MNEVEKPSVTDRVNVSTGRVNNNEREKLVDKFRMESQVSFSSVSDCQSDDCKDNATKLERKTSLQEIVKKAEDKRALYKQRGRSMSDGEARNLKNEDPTFEVFPSLPNSVLEKLGLRGDGPREPINEEELEQKFTGLALAFTIDATTIKDRCERQRNSRNQSEDNLNNEIDQLRKKITLLQPLCKDYETAEIFSTIMTQIDIILNAASLASMYAERFGSVQHEERLTESVGLMVSHVQMLKVQRDASRKQLQYTKRVLQNSADSPRGLSRSPTNNVQAVSPLSSNMKIIGTRRASIAAFSRQVSESNPNGFIEVKKVTRRTSDLNLRTGMLNRRPTKLDLGEQLVEIKEGISELPNENDKTPDVESEETNLSSTPNISSPEDEIVKEIDISKLPLREKVMHNYRKIRKSVECTYNTWADNGKLHEVCTFCALFSFSLSLVLLVNIFTEYEYAKRGILSWSGENDKGFSNVKK